MPPTVKFNYFIESQLYGLCNNTKMNLSLKLVQNKELMHLEIQIFYFQIYKMQEYCSGNF